VQNRAHREKRVGIADLIFFGNYLTILLAWRSVIFGAFHWLPLLPLQQLVFTIQVVITIQCD